MGGSARRDETSLNERFRKPRTGLDGLPREATELVAELDEALLALLAGLPHNLANGPDLVGGGAWRADQLRRVQGLRWAG